MSITHSAKPPNRLQNDPFAVVDEMLEGIRTMFGERIVATPSGRGLILVDRDPRRRVSILTGGGSGHEPGFFGYLGSGLADAVAVGNVFASPSAIPTVEAVRAIGLPSLFIFGNYDGDVMNFGMATDLLADEGMATETVLVTDDVVSAPPGSESDRRGVAGDLIVLKAAGARADEGGTLEEVAAAARHANIRTRTAGVGLAGCTLPTLSSPIFELPAGTMDVGVGIHGEAGIRRGSLLPADEVADELLDMLLAELPLGQDERAALVVNLLGATPYLEGFIVFRAVARALAHAGVRIVVSGVGEYFTSLDMRGLSITLTSVDDELHRLLRAPAEPLFAPRLQVSG